VDYQKRVVREVQGRGYGAPHTVEVPATVGIGVGVKHESHTEGQSAGTLGIEGGVEQRFGMGELRESLAVAGIDHAGLERVGDIKTPAEIVGQGGAEQGINIRVGAYEEALGPAFCALSFEVGEHVADGGVETVAEPPLEKGGVVARGFGPVVACGYMDCGCRHAGKDKARRDGLRDRFKVC